MSRTVTFDNFFQRLIHEVRDGQGLVLDDMVFHPREKNAISKFSAKLTESEKQIFLYILLSMIETTIYNVMQFIEEPASGCELLVIPDSDNDKVPILNHMDNLHYEASLAVSKFASLHKVAEKELDVFASE